ncbi:major capsid protein P2 [uncultured Hydrogenophaga sp.]|uniref:major capsid protein P2 n=1 Tax=uncultured Hydrogenophaga sp. TaxID=199683 RepID=UPI002584E9A1|nr:major capsid protein P2 [uncultured Hydrogenophaga sp.]
MNKQIRLDAFQNVANSGVAINDLNKLLGTVLEKITLTLGGTFTRSMITALQLKANGKVIWETSGARLDLVNMYNGGSADVTILKLDFMDRRAVTVNARQAGALDLSAASGITQLRMEVTIAGATNPTLVGFADVSPPVSDPAAGEAGIRFLIKRKHQATYVVGGAGEFALPVPHLDPAGGGSNYSRICIYSANLTAIKTVRDGITEHELTKAQNEAAQKDNFKAPQSGLVVFDPVQTGTLMGNTWDTRKGVVGSATFYASFSSGETITIETEELIPLAAF